MSDEVTAKPNKDALKITQEIADELLTLMGSSANFEVVSDEENDALMINILSEEEAGLLIGTRGDTVRSIQSIIGMIYRQRTGDWKRILVNVADWREKQEEKLVQLAENTANRVLETGESTPIYNLSPADRRVVHMVLKDNPNVQTESLGEGQDRHLVVSLRQK